MDYFTPEEIAQKLKVKITTVWRWIRLGKLSAFKVGKSYRISDEQFEKFLNDLEVSKEKESP